MISRNHVFASLLLLASAVLLATQATAQGLVDSDGDGLPNAVEERLSSSPLAVMESDSNAADTDGDGVPDLAEWVLTGQVSDPSVPVIVPGVRMTANRAPGESWARVYIGTVGDPVDFDQWLVVKASEVAGIQAVAPYLIAETYVGEVPVMMFGISIRVADLSAVSAEMTSIGVAGVLGEDVMPATLILFLDGEGRPAVQFIDDPAEFHAADPNTPLPQHVEMLDPLFVYGLGSGQGQVGTDPPPPPPPAEVCGVSDKREPSNVPGLLRSVVLATGCTSGAWACPAGVCTMSGVGADKPCVDIFSLLGPPSGG